MATTLTTYFYKGDNATDATRTFDINPGGYQQVTAYIDVFLYYGDYLGADQVGAVQPRNLSGLMNVPFKAEIYILDGEGHPLSVFSTPRLIARQDLFENINLANIVGTKFTFQSNCFMDPGCNEVATPNYAMVWSTGRVEMPYGPDMIFIEPQNGISDDWQHCIGG